MNTQPVEAGECVCKVSDVRKEEEGKHGGDAKILVDDVGNHADQYAFAPLFHSISSLKNLPPGLPFQALAILLSGQYQQHWQHLGVFLITIMFTGA